MEVVNDGTVRSLVHRRKGGLELDPCALKGCGSLLFQLLAKRPAVRSRLCHVTPCEGMGPAKAFVAYGILLDRRLGHHVPWHASLRISGSC